MTAIPVTASSTPAVSSGGSVGSSGPAATQGSSGNAAGSGGASGQSGALSIGVPLAVLAASLFGALFTVAS